MPKIKGLPTAIRKLTESDRPIIDRPIQIKEFLFIQRHLLPQTGTGRTHSVGMVKGVGHGTTSTWNPNP